MGKDRWVGFGWDRLGRFLSDPVVLTVLGDEGQAAVHDDRNVIPTQLLLPQGVSAAASRPLDVPVPQVKVRPGRALQVERSEEGDRPASGQVRTSWVRMG